MNDLAVQVAALRAALRGDGETFEALAGQSKPFDDVSFGALTASALAVAARRHFPPGSTTADIVRFVGYVRARNQAEQAEVDADAAEQILVSIVRGEPARSQYDDLTMGYAQFALLAELVTDLNDAQLDALLGEARRQADRWLAEQHGAN